jgi:putative ABC transport system permease protein
MEFAREADMLHDVRLALRSLRRAPAYAVAAISALALAIGANTALFSLIESTLLRAAPYPHAEQLLILQERTKTFDELSVSLPDFVDWRAQSGAQFSGMAAFHRESFTLTGSGDPDRVSGRMVSSDFFGLLGAKPQLGRFFQPADDAAGAQRTVVLSNSLWQRRFGSDPRVVGQSLQLSSESYTIIGVAAPGFRFFSTQDLFVPIGLWSDQFDDRDTHPGITVVGRLRPGVTIEQARAAMDAVAERLEKQYPKSNTGERASLKTLREIQTEDFRVALLVLWGAVGFVLLIAAANVANLALARATARAPEIAIRTALGASRARLLRELLTESVLLAVIGGALGVLLAYWGLAALLPVVPESLRLAEVKLNGTVLAFTLGLSVATGLAFGALPALRASTPDLDAMLRESHATDSRPRRRLRSALVVTEIALALMLLIGAGLLMRSFAKAAGVDLGFQPRGLVAFEVSLPERRYPDGSAEIRFEQELRRRLEALPGVKAVAVTPDVAPFLGNTSTGGFWIDGRERPPDGKHVMSYRYDATPGFLAAMGGRLLRGRDLRDTDDAGHPAILVDDAFVRTFFPGDDPIGRQVNFDGATQGIRQAEIVGVYGRMEQSGPGNPDSVQAGMITPFAWNATLGPQWFRGLLVMIRADGDVQPLIGAARRQVLELDPEMPIYGVKTMEAAVREELANRRFSLLLLGLFAGVAVLLAAVGVYGVMSYGVVQRTREIGIRMALGARQQDVLRLVVRDGARLAALGAGLGLCLAAALSRVLRELLYGVSPFDPLSYAGLTIVLASVALLASWLPARRAARVDPNEALRAD